MQKKTDEELLDEVQELRTQLEEAQETLNAIKRGEVDGLVISTPKGEQVYTITGAEKPYRALIEDMREGAVMLSDDNTVLYCNIGFAKMLKVPMEKIVGVKIETMICPTYIKAFEELLSLGRTRKGAVTKEITIQGKDILVPTLMSINSLQSDTIKNTFLVVTDLSLHMDEEVKRYTIELELAQLALSESEQRWATTLASIGDAVIATDMSGKIKFMNAVAEKLTAWTLGEALGRPIKDIFNIINEFTRKTVENPVNKVLEKGTIFGLANHTLLVRKDRTEIAIDDSGAPIRSKDGKITGVVLIFRDITDRKKAEDVLRKSEEEYSSLFSNMIDGFAYCQMIFDEKDKPVDFVYLQINDAFERITGLKRDVVVGKKVTEAIPGIKAANPELFEIYGRVALTGQKEKFEIFFNPLNIWLSISVYSPRKGYFAAVFEDITGIKKAGEALQQQKVVVQQERDRLASLLNSITDEVWFADTEKKFTLANPSAVKDFKLDSSTNIDVENLAETSEVYGSDGSPRPVEEAPPLRALRGEIVKNQEETVRTPESGELRTRLVNSAPVRNESGTIIGSVSVVRDITDRKKAEEAVARQAELIDLSPDAIIVRKLDGTITFWSKGAEKLYGWTKNEAIGKDINTLLKTEFPQPQKDILNKIDQDGKWSGEIVHLCKNGDKVAVQSFWLGKFGADGKIVEMLESNVDITQRIELQTKLEESAVRVEEYANQMEELANKRADQLKDAERLAAIGATAGMVGHDIRNPLQAITGDVYLAKTELASIPEGDEKSSIQESLIEIEKNVDYINKIVADLQDFARPLKPNVEETDIELVINELLKKNGLPENVKVTVKVDAGTKKIRADSTFINRIMYNLVNNAVQAMPKGGQLTIHAYKEANDVVINVKDTGVGIPEAVKGKLFTPMFTTKAKGQGFGLAVIKRMTEALGGTVTFESTEGKGTTFIIRLPPPKS